MRFLGCNKQQKQEAQNSLPVKSIAASPGFDSNISENPGNEELLFETFSREPEYV